MESITSQSNTSAAPFPQWRGCQEALSRETEECLIDSALRGHDGAFWELIQPHLASLNRFARVRVRSDPEAEDIVQQAVLRALSRLRQFRGEASFRTWLTAIASNEVSQWRRGRAGAAIGPLPEREAANLRDPAHAPDVQFERRQEVERLRQALTRLPEKYRCMIQLRDLHELSIAETARSLALTTAAVKTRHHRARKLLISSFARVKQAA
jgi:RNA polymerase sigma-70 factor (ECF subfamily)